jgi:hypothetical protein
VAKKEVAKEAVTRAIRKAEEAVARLAAATKKAMANKERAAVAAKKAAIMAMAKFDSQEKQSKEEMIAMLDESSSTTILVYKILVDTLPALIAHLIHNRKLDPLRGKYVAIGLD